MPNIMNEPDLKTGDQKIEASIRKTNEQIYNEMVKREQAKVDEEAKLRVDTEVEERMRKMGFATPKDVESRIAEFYRPIQEEMQKMRTDMEQFIEKIARARVQGVFDQKEPAQEKPHTNSNRPFWNEIMNDKKFNRR